MMKPVKWLCCAIALSILPIGNMAMAREVTHSLGTVEVPDDPRRVVVLTNEGTEALLALGVTPIGAANSWNGDPWWDHIEDRMTDVTPLGNESAVNLEMVAALQPDLILATRLRHEAIYPQLSAIAPTVVSERLRGDWKENFRLYAEALGKTEKAQREISDYDAEVADLRQLLGDHLQEKVSVIRFMPGHIRIYQLDSFSGVVLKQLGFQRPENQNVEEFSIQVGTESIPDMDGDRIFHFTWDTGNGDGPDMARDIMSNPLWQSLSAVSSGRVHAVSDAIWNTAGGILAARLMLADIARIYGVDQ
ncbi:ABC transporter substrate-binding protein [Paracoccus alkanivorans]|nr:iron-siderophore ABC transporter substrate-binding protein [Paracoccus alkanivorans]